MQYKFQFIKIKLDLIAQNDPAVLQHFQIEILNILANSKDAISILCYPEVRMGSWIWPKAPSSGKPMPTWQDIGQQMSP